MTKSSRAYFLVPVIYVAVILGLLFLQFSGGERFTRSVGPLTLQATRGAASEDGTPEVRELSISFDGLTFRFDEESGLIVETTEDVTDQPVTGYEVAPNGFTVDFEGGYRLGFLVAEDPSRELQLRMELPEQPVGLLEVAIPFTLAGAPADPDRATPSFVTVAVSDQEYYFTAPPNARIDLDNRKLVLEPEAAGQAVRFVEAREGDPAQVVGWFEDASLAVGDGAYREAVAAWVSAAYRGWRDGRYNATGLTWDGPAGFAAFSEEALTAYLAEAWVRDEYDRAFAEMRRARDLHPNELSLLSAPFLGNLREIREQTLESDRLQAESLRERIAAADPTLFRQRELFSFAYDRAGPGVYDELVAFAGEVDLRRLDLVSAIGLLQNLFLTPLPDDRARELSLRAVDLIRMTVLGSVVRTDAGFFVQTAPGQIDLERTAIAGAVLNAYGQSRSDRLMTTIGRNLVLAVLAQADANGMVPSSLLVRGETVERADGQVAPETLYPIMADAGAYPRQVSFTADAGRPSWAWTIVNIAPVRLTDTEWRFELTYPRLRTHYLILQGVPVFERMELFGQTWRDAPDFEIYSKGRHYNDETNTLMIKYYDDSVRREIVLFY